jgi:hypothetical protein
LTWSGIGLPLCAGLGEQANGMNCGKRQIFVSFGLFWEYVSAMNHCGKWI